MARIARRNRLPDSLPVVLRLLEASPWGVTISDLQREILAGQLWDVGPELTPRPLYHRIYGVLKLLRKNGMVRQVEGAGREALWVLDAQGCASQRRRELAEVIRPFIDGCMTLTDSGQLLSGLRDLVEDGTVEAMLAERRGRGRRLP